jgi:hypothetical protein
LSTPSAGAPDPVTVTGGEDDTETESGEGKSGGRRKINISRGKRANAAQSGDGSNMQFAILGLYAAFVANVHAPKETWQDALKWYESTLKMQGTYAGGWTYSGTDVRASMTCAGAASVRMCDLGLGKADASRRLLDAGKSWLTWKYQQIMSSRESRGGFGYFYNLYALERACILNGWVKLGDDDWYNDGAKWLVDNQADSGGWNGDDPIDTCFAILFLKRAVMSVSGSVVVTPDDPEEEPE